MPHIDSELFVSIDEIAIDTGFIKIEEVHDNILKSYSIKGSSDLNSDGKKDLVDFLAKFRYKKLEKSVLQINNSSIEYDFINPFEVYVIDLDTKDKFIEFVVYDDGPSGDPSYTFFRFTGNDILLLGKVNGFPKFDSHGRMITSSANFICPEIIFEIAEIIDNKIIYTVIDSTKYLNKEYKVCNDFNAYYIEYESIPKEFKPLYDIEETFITKDSIIKINHIEFLDNVPYWYEVELENGIRGILYFWLGD